MLEWLFNPAMASTPVDAERAAAGAELGVSIDLPCGALIVRGAEVPKVKVTGTIDDPDALSVTTSPGHVSIDVASRFPNRNCAQLEVWVPRAAAVDVETMSASLTVEAVTGPVELETISGPITVTTDGSGVSAESISGAITVRGAAKRVEASTVSGAIWLDRVVGPVRVESVSGSIRVVGGGPLPSLSAETVSASVTVAASFDPDARVSLESHSGALVLALPTSSDTTLTASTLSGAISSAFGPSRGAEHTLTLGGGRGHVHLETFSGPIAISRLDPQ
ncbi:MAG: DUF4097 family beta strand repeat-containing protein [Myxococcota bacterium]